MEGFMEPSDLKKLIAELTEWRLNKKNKTDRLPASFWERAIALDKKYPKLCVRERCKLNSVQWAKHKSKNVSKFTSKSFVELPSQSLESAPSRPSSEVALELKLPSGITVRFF